jgi:hypothetical protein
MENQEDGIMTATGIFDEEWTRIIDSRTEERSDQSKEEFFLFCMLTLVEEYFELTAILSPDLQILGLQALFQIVKLSYISSEDIKQTEETARLAMKIFMDVIDEMGKSAKVSLEPSDIKRILYRKCFENHSYPLWSESVPFLHTFESILSTLLWISHPTMTTANRLVYMRLYFREIMLLTNEHFIDFLQAFQETVKECTVTQYEDLLKSIFLHPKRNWREKAFGLRTLYHECYDMTKFHLEYQGQMDITIDAYIKDK